MEVELKLVLDPKFKEALLRHPLLNGQAASKRREQTLADTYFDTPDLQLRQSDIGLRVRRVDGGWVQTIKSGGAVHGPLHARHEWESPVTGAVPELTRLRDVVDDKKTRRNVLDAAAMGKGLAPIFTTKVKRMAWELHPDSGDLIECALDQGRLECGGKNTAITELELEMKSGDPVHLFDLALALQKDIPLQIGSQSKADRGYALFTEAAPAAVKATPLSLSADMSVEEAFQQIAFNTMAQIQDNVDGVAERQDVESLHQMRVGMRRLRSALGMYKRVLRLPQELQQELDWLATELGDARDWDVLADTTLAAVAGQLSEPADMAGVQQAAADVAREHHVAVAAVVSSARYTRLMLNLTRWVQAMGWHDDPQTTDAAADKLAAPITKFARAILQRDQKRLRRRAAKLRDGTPAERHAVRIAAKKTRYAAEFFSSLLPPKRVQPYVKALSNLQDELGYLNDAAVAHRLLTTLPAEQPQLAAGVGFVKGFLAARTRSDDKAVVKLWKRVERLPMPR